MIGKSEIQRKLGLTNSQVAELLDSLPDRDLYDILQLFYEKLSDYDTAHSEGWELDFGDWIGRFLEETRINLIETEVRLNE